MKKALLVLLVFGVPNLSFATGYDLRFFKQRFSIEKNAAGDTLIVDKTLKDSNDFEVYLKNLSTYLTVTDNDTVYQIPTCRGAIYEKPDENVSKNFAKAFEWMKQAQVGKLLTDKKFTKVLKDIQNFADQFANDEDYLIMANLNNPTYFHDKEFGKFLQDKLQDVVKGELEITGYLKIFGYIADDYARHLMNKKSYHQNMLEFYLQTFPADELGLTESEKNRALSSIEDSRLGFGFSEYFKSKKIAKNFETYGADRQKSEDRNAENLWDKNSKTFDKRLFKINAGFSTASFQDSLITINLGVKKDRFDEEPSMTFDDECPDFVFETRKNYEFIRVALGMSPIPFSGKLFFLIKSKYQPQAISEGQYAAYLEATAQHRKKDAVVKQSMNPLL